MFHTYDSIGSTSTSEASESALGAKQKKKTKKVSKQKETEENTQYTLIFKRNPETQQEAVIKTIIENLSKLRQNDADKNLTKKAFDSYTTSIFQPLSDIADQLDLEQEKEKSTNVSEPILDVTIRKEDKIDLPSILTRSKTQKKTESEDEH